MARTSGLVAPLILRLIATVAAASLPGPDANGILPAIGYDPSAAFSVAQDALPAEVIHYNTQALLAMGNLVAEPSNHTEIGMAERDIFGNDDRENWENSDYPYSAMGKLSWSDGHWCTGTLIGPRHVLTARHCTPTTDPSISLRFSPFYYDGETRYSGSPVIAFIWPTDDAGECYYGEDWSVHILQDRLGEAQGWLGARALGPEWLDRDIFHNFGYPADRFNGERPIRSAGGRMFEMGGCTSDSPTLSNIDVISGQSGSPIWEYNPDRYVQGVLFGSSPSSSVWATGQSFVNGVVAARNDFP
ncbi:trypsin-like cysteine/serine peptidase domain-containing protein [Microdochium trichocladiopsis]|uniref:Trypsin-like cysteine/serine peptidase domain-containing protein n=1 Tax=Microdochium trichocladiopsis TaxID=1682393 RepID=A0A9P9BMQ0_9PEZI|nr:trypsin-like cysteine/serine peptidase domain-containing protein [Microdochium trichocladiopsis]KAH7029843.1 trypsin-like cysteine/serine peptidase domain-containing protein [Microdochium trichocladiopsis]